MTIDIYEEFLQGGVMGFNPIFLAYRIPLINYARKCGLPTDAAEDAASDAFVDLFEFIGQFKSSQHLHNFLYLSTWYKCQIEHRKVQRLRILPEDAEVMADLNTMELIEIRNSAILIQRIVETIHEKLQLLPTRQREDFHAYFFDLKSHKEIAREKGVSIDTVRQNIWNGEKKLRKYLKKVEFFFYKNIGFR